MNINPENKEYLEQILAHPVSFSEVLAEENAKHLKALGFHEGYNYIFMLDPLITSSEKCHHVNPSLKPSSFYTLVSDQDITVFTGSKGPYEARIRSRLLEKRFPSNTQVYPMYVSTSYGSLLINLLNQHKS